MKRQWITRTGLWSVFAASTWMAGLVFEASAGTLYWAPSGSSQGGSGTWDNVSSQWYNGSGYATWSSGNEANFTTTGGTVMNTDDRTVSGLVFTVGGYTLGANGTDGCDHDRRQQVR